jgi:tetratricopeptide (TPR) repeat protein
MARKNWANALQICEEAFVHNPWDTAASMIAAEAAEQLSIPALAMWLMESVLPQAGDDLHFLRHAAHVYELNERWQKAIHCWERIYKLQPSDENAPRKINALAASATITKSGLKEAIQRTGDVVESPRGSRLEEQAEELKKTALSPEQRWQKEIQENPTNPRPYLDWGEALVARGRLDDAEKLLARGLKAIPGDDTLLRTHADVQIARLKRAIEIWTRKAQESPGDPEAQAKLRQISEMHRDYELKEFRRRVALHPDDAELHYQLGLRLAQADQHDEAIAEFQQARSDPVIKVQALLQLAISFEANGVLKLAERSLQDALKLVDPDDQRLLIAIHYRLGRIAEATGDMKKAEEHYNEVAANDYAYEDVAQRLRALSPRIER